MESHGVLADAPLAQGPGLEPAAVAVRTEVTAAPRDYVELTKPRITALVLVTAAAGFYLGSAGSAFDVLRFLSTLLGVALVAAGTSGMNQVLERDVDALMARTRSRPLPSGRLRTVPAAVFSGALAGLGIAFLALTTNLITAGLAAATFLVYDFVYTPLKRVHSFSTVVGAVPGALPILGGWTAASGEISSGGIVLFGILFLWQLPHFLALAWLLRDDYGAAGLRMLSVGDPGGFHTRHQALLYTLALLPASLLPAVLGLAGPFYFVAALGLGLGFLWAAVRFRRDVSASSARRLFKASIAYLPLLLIVLALDRV